MLRAAGFATVLPLAALALLAPGALPADRDASPLFQDDFEAEQGWQPMEEPGPCHGILLGASGRSEAAARTGAWGYQVFANKAGLPLSDHAFGAFLVDTAAHVAPLRYEVWATRDPSTNDSTQAGPEFGVQVTHEYPGEGFRTTSFGFQFVGSPHHAPDWSLWVANATFPDLAEWRPVHASPLAGGTWYRFVLEADLRIPAYRSLAVEGPGGTTTLDLTGLAIAREVKWQEEGTWISVDATSLWNTCGLNPPLSVFQARGWYDDVRLDALAS